MEREPTHSEGSRVASREFVEIANLLSQVLGNMRKLTEEEKERAKGMIRSVLSDVLE